MNNLLNAISSSVLSKDLQDCSLDELIQIASEYPYSSPLQLLLAAKLKEDGNNSFSAQWQRTLLYFNNPLILNYLFLSGPTLNESILKPAATKQAFTEPPDQESQEGPAIISPTLNLEEQLPANGPVKEDPERQIEEGHPEEFPIPALKIEPIDPSKAQLAFTPYFTVDYFASQGIKLSEEIKEGDRFGNQLKSFTNWLKEMRRLPEADLSGSSSLGREKKVEEMAEKSLTGENAVTGAMAEIWAKQGNVANAIAIYQKLSLQNPAKRAYFAAKIEHLKKSL